MAKSSLKKLCFVPLLFCLTTKATLAQTDSTSFALKNGDRVVFYGDSITGLRIYPKFVEELVLSRYPDLKVNFYDAGMGGDKVTGGGAGDIDTRLARDVFPLHPTVVTVMLGMNDGGYGKLDPDLAEAKYEAGYRALVQKLKAKLPDAKLWLIRPTPYDELVHGPAPFPSTGYSKIIQHYGDIVPTIANENDAGVIDLYSPIIAEMQAYLKLDRIEAKAVLPDRIHPQASGSWAMALGIVEAWKMDPIISDVKVDASGGPCSTKHAIVTEQKMSADGALRWTQTDEFLPAAVHAPATGDGQSLLFKTTDLSHFDIERLSVVGLTGASYTLTIDDTAIGVFTRKDLTDGIDLTLYTTPMLLAALDVDHATEKRMRIDAIRFDLLTDPRKIKDREAGVAVLENWRDVIFAVEIPMYRSRPHLFRLLPTHDSQLSQ